MTFVGEIGISRKEYLYELNYVDILLIERGYNRRISHQWSRTRWETYHLMIAQCGSENLRKSGIYSPKDLLTFPWEKEKSIPLTHDEIAEMQAEMDAYNEELRKLKESSEE